MNLENFLEEYYEHIINGCENKICLYSGCQKCPLKNSEWENLRTNPD